MYGRPSTVPLRKLLAALGPSRRARTRKMSSATPAQPADFHIADRPRFGSSRRCRDDRSGRELLNREPADHGLVIRRTADVVGHLDAVDPYTRRYKHMVDGA